MATSSKEFINNFRNARLNPFSAGSSPSLITRDDVQKRNIRLRGAGDMEIAKDIAAQENAVDRQVRETAPLRNAIRDASGGRVMVDRSIYDQTALERILRSVKAMEEKTGGALLPGYTLISDKTNNPSNRGEAQPYALRETVFPPGIIWQFPSDNYGGKNAPYRVRLNHANQTMLNDVLAREALDNNWTIENFNDDDVESATHTHELAHTAYYDALKKTQSPALTLSPQEKAKREEFRATHPSLQEVFDIAARNTGFDTVKDAAASISDYAFKDAEEDKGLDKTKNWSPSYHRLPEVFAEAYNDFIYNGQYASDYAKELIKLYINYVNDYNKMFSNDKILLNSQLFSPGFSNHSFISNLRRSR